MILNRYTWIQIPFHNFILSMPESAVTMVLIIDANSEIGGHISIAIFNIWSVQGIWLDHKSDVYGCHHIVPQPVQRGP